MRKIFSDSDQCLSNRRGHNVHLYALRDLSEHEFLPTTVRWQLGTSELEVDYLGQSRLLWNHNPLEIARVLQVQALARVSFCHERSLLRVELAQNALRFFSLAEAFAGPCLDHYLATGEGKDEL